MPGPRGGDAPARRRVRLGPMTALTWDAVLAWRMRRQRLAERAPAAALLDVVSRHRAACTRRSPRRAELTLWARVDGPARPATVERLLWEERALVKTWAMRGTLHLLPGRRAAAVRRRR